MGEQETRPPLVPGAPQKSSSGRTKVIGGIRSGEFGDKRDTTPR